MGGPKPNYVPEGVDTGKTEWADYAGNTSYSSDEENAKREFIARFTSSVLPHMLWDLGCNSGEYSQVALHAGAENIIGFDTDQGALEAGFARAHSERLLFLPLYLDITNPTPNQGWAEKERRGFKSRASADAVMGKQANTKSVAMQ